MPPPSSDSREREPRSMRIATSQASSSRTDVASGMTVGSSALGSAARSASTTGSSAVRRATSDAGLRVVNAVARTSRPRSPRRDLVSLARFDACWRAPWAASPLTGCMRRSSRPAPGGGGGGGVSELASSMSGAGQPPSPASTRIVPVGEPICLGRPFRVGGLAGGRRALERRVVRKDRSLELLKSGSGFDSELLDEY